MKPDTQQDYQERMLKVLVHIRDNLDQTLSLDELAGVAHFSPFHFHRIFRGMVGESLKAYLRRLKLERAANQLRASDDSIIRVALNAGFESHAAFSRSFKALMGLTPSQWREKSSASLAEIDPVEMLDHNQRKGIMNKDFKVDVVKEEEIRVAFVRHTGPYAECGNAWSALCKRLGPEGRLGPNTRFIGLSYDDPETTPEDKLRYDACAVVGEDFQPAGEVGIQVLAGGKFARCVHVGPYEELKITYGKLMGQWLPQSGQRYRLEPTREVYLNDPESTRPEELLTEVYLPLEGMGVGLLAIRTRPRLRGSGGAGCVETTTNGVSSCKVVAKLVFSIPMLWLNPSGLPRFNISNSWPSTLSVLTTSVGTVSLITRAVCLRVTPIPKSASFIRPQAVPPRFETYERPPKGHLYRLPGLGCCQS